MPVMATNSGQPISETANTSKTRLDATSRNTGVTIGRGFVRAMPAVSTSTAAYLDIHNLSEQNLTLVGASNQLGPVMIHGIEEKEGMVMQIKNRKVKYFNLLIFN